VSDPTVGSRTREKVLKDIREGWFQNHEAEYYGNVELGPYGNVELLIWGKPGTIHGYVEYVTRGNKLIVTGDYGSAVYCWSQNVTLKWVAGCNYDYIHGKCDASAGGRSSDWHDWDPAKVETTIREAIEEDDDLSMEHPAVVAAMEHVSEQPCWYEFLGSEEAQSVLGCDAWEYGDAGEVLPIFLLAHVEGLKMAMKQLEPKDERKDTT
jgi:hypothetical protein